MRATDDARRRGVIYLAGLLILVAVLGGCGRGGHDDAEAAKAYVVNAKQYRSDGDYDSAVVQLKNALRLVPNDPAVRQMLGEIYLSLGDGASAEKEYRRARRNHAQPNSLLVPLAEALALQGAWARLLKEFEPTQGMSGREQAHLLTLRGEAHLGLGQSDLADEAFASAVQLEPNLVAALLGQARLALEVERFAAARQLINQALAHADQTEATEAWSILADVERRAGDYPAAEAAFARALQHAVDPDAIKLRRALMRIDSRDYAGAASDLQDIHPRHQRHPYVLFGSGFLAIRAGRYAEAQAHLEKLGDVDPNYPLAAYYLGVAHFAQGAMQEATHYLGQAADLAPSYASLRLLGQARYVLGDYAGVVEALEPLVARRPEDAIILSLLGNAYTRMGDDVRGAALLERALSVRPDTYADRVQLGFSLNRLGEHDAALEQLETAVGEAPDSERPRLVLILGYLQAQRLEPARALAEQMRVEAPDSPATWTALALTHAAAGKTDEAADLFARAWAAAPGDPTTGLNFARLELRRGEVDRARSLYREVLARHPHHLFALLDLARLELGDGDHAAARTALEEAIAAHPTALAPKMVLARVHIAAGEAARALSLFEDISEQHPDNPEVLTLIAEAQLAGGEVDAAVRTAESVVEIVPEDAEAHYLLARACARKDDMVCLRTGLRGGLRLAPQHPQARSLTDRLLAMAGNDDQLGLFLFQLYSAAPGNRYLIDRRGAYSLKVGRAQGAVEIYQEARKRYPDEWQWALRLAYAFEKAGQPEASLATLREWQRNHPDDVRAYFALGSKHLVAGRDTAALQAFVGVLQREPRHAQALNNAAWLLREKEPQLALEYAERAVDLEPGFATRDTLGRVLLELGEDERAVNLLEQAFHERPASPGIRYRLALALARTDQGARARQLLRELLDSDTHFSERADAEILLKQLDG